MQQFYATDLESLQPFQITPNYTMFLPGEENDKKSKYGEKKIRQFEAGIKQNRTK